MAQWTNIPTDRIEPGKPIRAIDGLALRDNPIAIAEGAAGAPKISEQAFNTNSINGNRLRSGTVTNTQIANMNAGKLNSGTVPGARMPMGAGAVGTYVLARLGSTSAINFGATISASSLAPANANGNTGAEGSLSGTWRCMGNTAGTVDEAERRTTLWIRIS